MQVDIVCRMSAVGSNKWLAAFGEAVRATRKDRELSQEALAERAGLHRTYIGSVERGERNVSLVNIQVIARALGLSASELIARAERSTVSR